MPQFKGPRGGVYNNPRMADGKLKYGSKASVFHGNAHMTAGGLRKKDLLKRNGRIVSARRSRQGKKLYKNNATVRNALNANKIPKGKRTNGTKKKKKTKKNKSRKSRK